MKRPQSNGLFEVAGGQEKERGFCCMKLITFASLCIEFKTRVGKQSEEQKEFQKQAESCRNKYVVVRSASQAIEELRKYLS